MSFLKMFELNSDRFLLLMSKNILPIMLVFTIIFSIPLSVKSEIQETQTEGGAQLVRSLESLRDLDYETWQVVVYRDEVLKERVILRIVGFPGTLRIDHPSALEVRSGRRSWNLQDLTLENKKLATDPRAAAAEFDLSTLLIDLSKNSPLRLKLQGVFSELPIPPYLVKEWRSFI